MSTLTATAAQRQALLDLQDLDTEIDRAKAALNRLRTDEEFARAKKDAADLADQVATAAGPGALRETCHEVRHRMQRGVVESVIALPADDDGYDGDGDEGADG